MSRFKVGDLVTPINTDHCNYIMQQLIGKTLVVTAIDTVTSSREVVWAKLPGGYSWRLYSDGLRLVAKAQTEPTPQKPLRRGDLVEFRGSIWVVIDTYSDGTCWIGSITGHAKTRCHAANEMTRVGSIRKKAKRLEQEKKA